MHTFMFSFIQFYYRKDHCRPSILWLFRSKVADKFLNGLDFVTGSLFGQNIPFSSTKLSFLFTNVFFGNITCRI